MLVEELFYILDNIMILLFFLCVKLRNKFSLVNYISVFPTIKFLKHTLECIYDLRCMFEIITN